MLSFRLFDLCMVENDWAMSHEAKFHHMMSKLDGTGLSGETPDYGPLNEVVALRWCRRLFYRFFLFYSVTPDDVPQGRCSCPTIPNVTSADFSNNGSNKSSEHKHVAECGRRSATGTKQRLNSKLTRIKPAHNEGDGSYSYSYSSRGLFCETFFSMTNTSIVL